MAWLTPYAEGGTLYRLLRIPDGFVSQVNGALAELANAWNWEEFGTLTPDECAAIMNEMFLAYLEGSMMIGMVVPYVGDTIPGNCLLCDGTVYNRVDYPDLYAVLPTAYKDSPDTFHPPDLVGFFVMGDSANTEDTGGEASHTLTVTEIPAHTHDVDSWGNNVVNGYLGEVPALVPSESTVTSSSTGGGEAHNNLPPYHALTYVIIAR